MLKKIVRKLAFKYRKFERIYRILCKPGSTEWGSWLRIHGGLYSIGEQVTISPAAIFLDPAYVRIGNNVGIAACTMIGHDGCVRILNNVSGKKLDSVGHIDIKDNSFIGHGAIIMPRVTIGPNSVVAAGSVVTADVPPGAVVGGNPAKLICTMDDLIERIEERTSAYPWAETIKAREGSFDIRVEGSLVKQRQEHFYRVTQQSRTAEVKTEPGHIAGSTMAKQKEFVNRPKGEEGRPQSSDPHSKRFHTAAVPARSVEGR